jgi:hypothetical protein
MAIIKRKIENLKPGKEYLVTVRGKNADINTSAELAETIRFTVPQDDTQPSAITNLALYQSLQNVMFVFDFVNDADIARYEYELYNGNTTSSSLISTGFNDANVFTVSVENLYANSGLGTGLIPFWGRVRAVDTSGNNGTWTSLTPTSGDAPLIDNQYIGSLTASKITAGTIGAQTIQLNGANSILRSSFEYSGLPAWIIRGDGTAEFRNVTIGGDSTVEGLPDLDEITEVLNFNDRNDRNSLIPNAPGIPTGGNAIDHTMNTDGSCNISFEWTYTNDLNPAGQNNIDGFIVYVYDAPDSATPSGSYTFGTDTTKELTFPLDADRRAFILYSAPANHYYTFGVKAYRVVDDDIATPAILYSSMARSSVSGEDPYRPSLQVPFAGDVTGTVDGLAATAVKNAAFNFNANNDRISTTPAAVDAAPVLTATQNLDASIDLTVSWGFTGSGNSYNVDGFVVYLQSTAVSSGNITTSNLNTDIQEVYVTAQKRSHTFSGIPSARFYRAAVRAFRVVDTDINVNGIIFGPLTNSTEKGSTTPLIGGNTGISIGSGKIYIGIGTYNNSNTGFYVDSTGQFSLKDKLTWDGTTLSVTGAVTATSGTFTGAVNATSGNFTGSVSVGTNGDIRSGQTAYDTGTGFFLGSPGGNPRFSIGNSAGNKMTWDGTTLNIVGTITGTLTGSISSSATITGGILRTATTGNRIEISSSNIDVYGQTSKINYKDDASTYIQYSGGRGVTINGAYGSLKVGHQTGTGFEGIYATATSLVNIQVGSSPYRYIQFDNTNPWGFTGILDVYDSVGGIALVANRGDGFSTLHHHDYLDSTTAYLLASAGASHTFISSPSGYGLRFNPSEQGGQSVEINAVGDVFRVVVGNATGFRVDTGPNTYSNITATSNGSSVRYTVISGNEVRFERVTSLRRLKSDIKDFTNGLDLVRKMQPRFFKWNRMDQDNDYSAALRECHVDIGFIAEEMEEIDPRFATYKGNVFDAAKDSDVESLELEAWSETRVVVSAIAAIKELDTLLRDLINRIENIETIIKKSK